MILHNFAEICISKELFILFVFKATLKEQVKFQDCFQLEELENLHLAITESKPTIL